MNDIGQIGLHNELHCWRRDSGEVARVGEEAPGLVEGELDNLRALEGVDGHRESYDATLTEDASAETILPSRISMRLLAVEATSSLCVTTISVARPSSPMRRKT